MCKPRRRFIEILIENSMSKDFDVAMCEWVVIGKVINYEVNFKSHCDLCGAANYELNYVIYNVKKKQQLQIGSDCVKRFIPTNRRYFDKYPIFVKKLRKKHRRAQLKIGLIDQYHFICNQVVPPDLIFNSFCDNLIKLLKSYNQVSLLETSEGAIKVLTKVLGKLEYTEAEVRRLKLILCNRNEASKIRVPRPVYQKKKVDKYGIVIGV